MSYYFVTPFEVWVLHQSPVSELPLEKVMDLLIQQTSEQSVQASKVVRGCVLVETLLI